MLLEQQPSHRTHSYAAAPRTSNLLQHWTIHHTAGTTVLRSRRWAKDCPKHVELIQRSIILLLLHLVGYLYYISITYWMDRDNAANLKPIFGYNPPKHFLGNSVLQELQPTNGHCQLKDIYFKWDY